MIRASVRAVIVLIALCAAARAQTTQPSSAVDAVAPYIGEWHINATWAGGNALDARNVFEWGLNKKFIVVKTFVKQEDGKEYQRYEGIYADHEGKLMYYNFRFDGEADVRPMECKGHNVSNSWSVSEKDGSATNLRQSVELIDDNHFRWQVATQQKDGPWQTIMDGTWERVTKTASEARAK
jgi:hypothetical protein